MTLLDLIIGAVLCSAITTCVGYLCWMSGHRIGVRRGVAIRQEASMFADINHRHSYCEHAPTGNN